ncbi:hypothetical protein Taro_039613, partial [Colocasia esculenta]|nr:hypothetical protein [Colocasia esculenta]
IFRFINFCLSSVDTRSKQVDTSPRFQKGRSTLGQSRSTLDQGRSTLDPVSSRTSLQKWDNRSTLDKGSFCTVSRRALVCESSYSLCGLSRRAQFIVVVLNLESSYSGCCFEPSCS